MKKTFVANWKQNMTLSEIEGWLSEFGGLVEGFSTEINVVITPSHPYLPVVAKFAKKYDWLFVGAQDISAFTSGTHTGEVGGNQIKDYADYCIVGHSEREEKLDIILQKIDQAFENGLIPIIGFVEFEKLNDIKRSGAILLWEDPGNISQGGVFNPKPVSEIKAGMEELKEKYDVTGDLLYGGSINRKNIKELNELSGLNGGVTGGASLDPQHFFELISAFSQ